jgi:hypothetical protein
MKKHAQIEDGQNMDLRSWSVLPARWTTDKRLAPNDVRVLGALGLYTNQVGVCWPTYETLQRFTKLSRNAVMAAIKRLEEMGYVRPLKPEYWPGQKSKWLTNRYQVLWRGDDPLPRWEELRQASAINLGQDPDSDSAERAELAATVGAPAPERTHTDRELEGVAAAWNRALGKYGAFADTSLAILDAPSFLASLDPSQPLELQMVTRLERYYALRGSVPARLRQLV